MITHLEVLTRRPVGMQGKDALIFSGCIAKAVHPNTIAIEIEKGLPNLRQRDENSLVGIARGQITAGQLPRAENEAETNIKYRLSVKNCRKICMGKINSIDFSSDFI